MSSAKLNQTRSFTDEERAQDFLVFGPLLERSFTDEERAQDFCAVFESIIGRVRAAQKRRGEKPTIVLDRDIYAAALKYARAYGDYVVFDDDKGVKSLRC